jgi:hypothetical protein
MKGNESDLHPVRPGGSVAAFFDYSIDARGANRRAENAL